MKPPAAATDRRAQRIALSFGAVLGGCGGWWILATHTTRPGFSLYYHTPLAVAFGCWLGYLLLATAGRRRWSLIGATALALGLVLARLVLHWPLSGHGVLAAMIATARCWTWLRVLAAAILAQAVLTKYVGDTEPLSVIWGALAGLLLAAVAQRGS